MTELRVTIVVGEGYIPDLKRRMEEYDITPAELAREMEITKQEVSRWFSGRVSAPSMENVAKIELAIVNLRRSKARRKSPARGTAAIR